jgi:L-rhamnose mutarotase
MNKVVFTIRYEIQKDKLDEYFKIVRELKSLLKGKGIQDYSVFNVKGKENEFVEIYIYESREAWEEFDETTDERVDILMNKLADIIIDKTTKYSTLFELELNSE